jgi:hypothetical protein
MKKQIPRTILALSVLLTSQWSFRNSIDIQEGETTRDEGPTWTTNFRLFCSVTTVFDTNPLVSYSQKQIVVIYLFSCGLFNDAASSSNYIASNYMMNNELERKWKEVVAT